MGCFKRTPAENHVLPNCLRLPANVPTKAGEKSPTPEVADINLLLVGLKAQMKSLIWKVGMMKFPRYGKSKNSMVPNHQSVIIINNHH